MPSSPIVAQPQSKVSNPSGVKTLVEDSLNGSQLQDSLGSSQQSSTPQPSSSPQQVKQEANALSESTGVSQEEAEEMVTLYHITGSAHWGKTIASKKAQGLTHDQLGGFAIDPERMLKERKNGQIGRGGDDLGPGFYTTDSLDFVRDYANKNFETSDSQSDSALLEFQVPKKKLEALKSTNIDKNDDKTFKQYFKDGFVTYEGGQMVNPKLDSGLSEDYLSGPIQDIAKSKWANGGGKNAPDDHMTTEKIDYGNGNIPLQYSFASKKGVDTLFNDSKSIKSTSMLEFMKEGK